MQLVIGTFVAPKLATFVKREQERLGIAEDEDGNQVNDVSAEEEPSPDVEAVEEPKERIPSYQRQIASF